MNVRKTLVVLSRLLLIGWASVWFAALPLFHTHLPGAFQQRLGLPHTVFSPDLPGEYWEFSHKTAPDEFQLSGLVFSSPELGFVASLEEDGKRKPLLERTSFFLLPFVSSTLLTSQHFERLSITHPKTRWSSYTRGSRAPPAPVSFT